MKYMHFGRYQTCTLTVCFAFSMIFLVLSTVCVDTVVGDNEAEMPKYSVGDEWKFSFDLKEEIGFVGTGTYEITEDSVEITHLGESCVCYKLEFTGSGTVYGEGVTGTWTMIGEMYAQKSDLSDVKYTSTIDATVTYADESITMKMVSETTYDPPLESFKGFPITAGKSWSAATTETTETQTTIDGEVDQETDTSSGTTSYAVLRTESITVSAGKFDTFVIKTISPDGSYTEDHYSPEAGFSVKTMEYDGTGELIATMELLEYNYAAAVSDTEAFPILIIIGIIIATAAVTSGLGYVLYKRRKPTAPTAPPTPPAEQPPLART